MPKQKNKNKNKKKQNTKKNAHTFFLNRKLNLFYIKKYIIHTIHTKKTLIEKN